jgi:hypothetical protein
VYPWDWHLRKHCWVATWEDRREVTEERSCAAAGACQLGSDHTG